MNSLFDSLKREPKIILLDYQATLVSNFHERDKWRAIYGESRPYTDWIKQEKYRDWLVDLIKGRYVILITARSYRYRSETLARINTWFQGQWAPQESYWNTLDLRPDHCKRNILIENIFPKHGTPDKTPYLALESNQQTRAMYAKMNITAIRIQEPIKELPKVD